MEKTAILSISHKQIKQEVKPNSQKGQRNEAESGRKRCGENFTDKFCRKLVRARSPFNRENMSRPTYK